MSVKVRTNHFLSSIGQWVVKEEKETAILLRNIPAAVVTLFVVSVICMNLLANKTIVQTDWIALDGGILILPSRYLCPIDNRTRTWKKSGDTISVHHYSASWQDEETSRRWRQLQDAYRREDTLYAILHAPNRAAIRLLGTERYERLKRLIKGKK